MMERPVFWLLYTRYGAEKNAPFIAMLQKAAERLGLSGRLMISEELAFEGDSIFCHGEQVATPVFALNRTYDAVACSDIALARRLETCGVPVYNNAEVSLLTCDKFRTYEVFSDTVPMMKTVLWRDVPRGGEIVLPFPYPVVAKPRDSHGGMGVALCPDAAALLQYAASQEDFIIQESADPGRDVRVYLLGGEIFAAVERRAAHADIRANFSLGGSVSRYELSEDETRLVRKIAGLVSSYGNFIFGGIDLIFRGKKAYLNELEDAAGTRMLYATGANIKSGDDITLHYLAAAKKAAGI